MFQIRRIDSKNSSEKTSGEILRTIRLQDSLDIGSSSHSRVRLNEPGISARHCRIELSAEREWIVEALDTPYIEINRSPVRRTELKAGDTIRIGYNDWRFELIPLEAKSRTVSDILWLVIIALCLFLQVAIVFYLEGLV